MTAPPSHASVTQDAQAVFAFGDSCVVGVDVTSARLRLDRFCADGSSTVTAPLGANDVAFTRDVARVAVTVDGWTVNLAWQVVGKQRAIRNKVTRTVSRDAPATLAGSISDGTTTATAPDDVQFADMATVVNGVF